MSVNSRPAFRGLLSYSFRQIFYPLWLLPFTVVAVLLPLHINDKLQLDKALSEPLAPALLATAMFICIVRWRRQRSAFLLWLTALTTVFFLRELHFTGTSTFVYVGFICLLILAWHQYPRLGPHMGSRLFMTLFSTTILSYIIAVGLDNHWWKFLPGDKYQWAAVEEYVEICGHLLLIGLASFSKPVQNPLLHSD